MVDLYYKYNPTLRSIVVKDPEFLGNAIHTWFSMQPFVEAVVAGARAGAERAARDQYRDIRFAEVTHRRIEGLFERIRAGSTDKEFHAALDKVADELRGYVGLTPAEAVARLRRASN